MFLSAHFAIAFAFYLAATIQRRTAERFCVSFVLSWLLPGFFSLFGGIALM